jgi:hypothetical protein
VKRPVDRIIAKLGLPGLVDVLSSQLSGTDLTSLLLEVMHRRAAEVRPAHLKQRYATDRFVAPPTVPFGALRRVEDVLLAACGDRFQMLTLAPLVPLGTHSALATVAQNKIVTTLRNNEVAADPTNALALAAAERRSATLRRDAKSPEPVSIGAFQRVVRAQHVAGPGRFAHFALFGLLSAGRDAGALVFERDAAPAHLDVHVRGLLALGAAQVVVSLTDFSGGRYDAVAQACRAALAGQPSVTCVDDPTRASGNGYYSGFCFKIHASFGGDPMETSDGGIVDWTQRLVGSVKERCFISGLGIDRVALAVQGRVEAQGGNVNSIPEEP